MSLFTAIHQIIRNGVAVEPGTVFDAGDLAAELQAVGAIRQPTQSESALYQLANRRQAPAPVREVAPESPAAADDRAALEARAKAVGVEFSSRIGDAKLLERVVEAESQSADPDVTEAPASLV